MSNSTGDTPTDNHEEALALMRQKVSQAMVQAHGHAQSSGAPQANDSDSYRQWYDGLTDEEKLAEWQRYNSAQPQIAKHQHIESQASAWQSPQTAQPSAPTQQEPLQATAEPDPAVVQPEFDSTALEPEPQDIIAWEKRQPKLDSELVHRRLAGVRLQVTERAKRHNHTLRSLRFAVLLGFSLIGIWQNQLLVAQAKSFVSPGANVGQSSIIVSSDNSVGPENKIIIPKIGVEVPVVFDQLSLEEDAIQNSLEDGVVRYNYPGTVLPGEVGNSVILGHSSSNFFGSGQYKFAFVLLNRLQPDDTFIIHYDSVRYVYRIIEPGVVVPPTDFSEITEIFDKPVVTLITCDPPGTNINRYIIQAEQISPDPLEASAPEFNPDEQQPAPQTVPSNSRGFFDSLF